MVAILKNISFARNQERKREEDKRKKREAELEAVRRWEEKRRSEKAFLERIAKIEASREADAQTVTDVEKGGFMATSMIDLEDFDKKVLGQFMETARYAAKTTSSARKGASMAAEDAANGYLSGDKLNETIAIMDRNRIAAQKDFKVIADEYEKAADRYVKDAFRFDAKTVADITPALSVLGASEADYSSLAEQYSSSYSALRAIAGAAVANGCKGWGTRLNNALDSYRESCEKQLVAGIKKSAVMGVLGQNEMWDTAISMRLDNVSEARTALDYVTGAQTPPVDSMQQAFNDYAFNS